MSGSLRLRWVVLCAVLILSVVGSGCHPAALPVAQFSESTTTGDAPLTVDFTDESTSGNPILFWAWDFGDGNTSSVQNPTHTYTEAGRYTITLTVTSVDGEATETKVDLITVTQDTSTPTAAFSATPLSGQAPVTVSFTDESIPGGAEIRGWYWQFGDGRISQEQHPEHTYTEPGTYTVSLRTFNLYGGNTLVREDLIVAVEPGTTGPCDPDDDTEDPIISSCPDMIELPRGEDCRALVPDLTSLITAVDNCGIQELRQQPPVGTSVIGVAAASVRVIDTSGNSTLCTLSLVPVDETPPVIVNCPEDRSIETDENCIVRVPNLTGEIEATDNCAVVAVSQTPAPGSTIIIPTDVTLTVRDSAGNTSTCTTNIAVVDVTPPTVTACATPEPLPLDDACTAVLPDLRNGVTATDFCTEVLIEQFPAPGTAIAGETTVTFTVSDTQGNSTTCEVQQTLVDEIAPEIIACAAPRTLELSDACAAVLPDMTGEVSATDNCAVVGFTQSPAPGTSISEDTQVVFRAADASGNDAVCSVTVSVVDSIDPVITTCPAPRTLELFDNCEAIVPNLTADVVATDNCGVVSIMQSPAIGSTIDGDTSVVVTVTDAAGNTDSCSVSLTVQDTIPPTPSTCLGNTTVPADVNCQGVIPDYTLTISTADNCEVASFTQSVPPGTVITDPTPLTLTLLDTSGNETVCNAIVSVDDVTDPEIVFCPADFTIETNDSCVAEIPDITTEVVVEDNCGDITVTQEPEAGEEVSEETVITLTATDDAGNSTECEVTVSLEDTEPPVITSCPSGTTLQLDGNCQAILPNFGALATATDNCRLEFISQSPAPGTAINADTTVTLTARDTSDNESSCTLQVTVEDVTRPTITACTGTVVVPVSPACEAIMPDLSGEVSATDNCGIASVSQSVAIDTVITEDTAVNLTVTDTSGNTSVCPIQIVLDTCSTESETQTPIGTVVSLVREPASDDNYQPGGTYDVRVRIERLGNETVRNLEMEETIPAGWSFAGVVSGTLPDMIPVNGATGTLAFSWDVSPDFPVEFIYQLNVPSNATDVELISGALFYETGSAKGVFSSNIEELFVPFDQTVLYYARRFPVQQVYLSGVPLLVSLPIRASSLGQVSTFTATEILPPGFSFQGVVQPLLNVTAPDNGATGEIDITLTNGLSGATEIIYRVLPEAGTEGIVFFDGFGTYPFGDDSFPTNRKQSYIPRGVPGQLVISRAEPGFTKFDSGNFIDLFGDFNVPFDPGTMAAHVSRESGAIDPANDYIEPVDDGDVAETQIDVFLPAVDSPFDTTLYLSATFGGAEIVSNTIPFTFFGCDETGVPQVPASVSQVDLRRRILGPRSYTPGTPMTFEIEIDVVGEERVTALAHEETISTGLFYDGGEGGCVAPLGPRDGDQGILSFAWFSIPAFPMRFSFDLEIPSPTTGVKRVVGDGIIRTSSTEINSNTLTTLIMGEETIVEMARPGLLLVPELTPVEIIVRLDKIGDAEIESLSLTETLPEGWSFGGLSGGTIPDTVPEASAMGALEFGFEAIPEFPFTLKYLASPPIEQANESRIRSSYDFKAMDENAVADIINDTLVIVE